MTQWQQVLEAVGLALGGDREGGRVALAAAWDATGPEDHARRCVLAHYLADLQADLADEVTWDERALAEYAHVDDADLTPVGIPSAAGLAPSLHLNLADGYLRSGRVDEARARLDAGLAAVGHLPDDGYGRMIREGLAGVRERLDAAR